MGLDPAWRRRRLRLGRWRRLTRWEFWPTVPIYLPVIPIVLWQALRHRSLTHVTAANPGMPSGGFVLDSKSEILRALEPSGHVAPFALLEPGAGPDALATQIRRHALDYPLVLKPDSGERGRGVAIVRNPVEAADRLRGLPGPTIVQNFVPGEEFGVFYERPPDCGRGRVTGLTLKLDTRVTGDGVHTLEWLILADPRAVCQARVFLELNRKRLDEVIPAGESVRLNRIGTHSRGAIFRDGGHAMTREMEDAFERVSRHFEGFHLGRYDVRSDSLDALQRGEFRVIELNGVTSEPTQMYHHGLLHAWRLLAGQWLRAGRIAALNRRAGHRPLPWRELWQRIRASRDAHEARVRRPP